MALTLDKLMPKTLVLAMESLFSENELKSWSISSGKFFSQVTIRFTPGFGQDDAMDTEIKHSKYKKMSPSQVKRDIQRASDRLKDEKKTCCNSMKIAEIDIESGNSINDIHIDADDSMQQQGVNKEIPSIEMPVAAACQADDIQDNATGDQDNTVSESDSDTEKSGSLESRTDEDIVCNVCDETIETVPVAKYYVCAQCSDSKTVGLFIACMKCQSMGQHKEHKSQMTLFTDPEVDHRYYCSQCGCEFKTPKTPVYRCAYCHEIDYEMCATCHSRGLHCHHQKHIQKVTRQLLSM